MVSFNTSDDGNNNKNNKSMANLLIINLRLMIK